MVMLAARFFEPSALMALPPETGRERMDSPCRSAVPSTSTPFPTSLVQHARYTLSSAKDAAESEFVFPAPEAGSSSTSGAR